MVGAEAEALMEITVVIEIEVAVGKKTSLGVKRFD
jgi:hypothetical protein